MEKNRSLLHRKKSACFFSGGVDAYTTLFRHIQEEPALITIWGADIKLSDETGWLRVKSHIMDTAKEMGLDALFIKSNFRLMIQEGELGKLVKESGDGWWHGFQHGIGIIGHAAPLAYLCGWNFVYIASSFAESMKGNYTCASDPLIDNYVEYCGCKTVHDGYEMDRQEKVRYLVSQEAKGRGVPLRVCWESLGGGNCCRCEKCYRTILEIVSEGGDPNLYGFQWGNEDIKRCRRDMERKIVQTRFIIEQFYLPIQGAMKENQSQIKEFDKYLWLVNMNFQKFNVMPMKIARRLLGFLRRAKNKLQDVMTR